MVAPYLSSTFLSNLLISVSITPCILTIFLTRSSVIGVSLFSSDMLCFPYLRDSMQMPNVNLVMRCPLMQMHRDLMQMHHGGEGLTLRLCHQVIRDPPFEAAANRC
jgi:hypothetical protein